MRQHGQMEVPGKTQKTVVMCGRLGNSGISTLTRGMVLEVVRRCADCTQLACCDRCSELLMGITNPVPLKLPLHEPATCASLRLQ